MALKPSNEYQPAKSIAKPNRPDRKSGPRSAKPAMTKTARLLALLGSRNGAQAAKLCETLGWQPHTLRAAVSGLRKQGHVIVAARPKEGGSTVYRMTGSTEVAQ